MQILQLHYAFSSRGAGENWDLVGPQTVGSFFGFQRGRSCGIRAIRAGIGLMDLILSALGRARSLGSFGCSVFDGRTQRERRSLPALVVSEMVLRHQEERPIQRA